MTGGVKTSVNSNVSQSYTYNNLGLVATETTGNFSIARIYDTWGRNTQNVYKKGNTTYKIQKYTYDGLSRLLSVSSEGDSTTKFTANYTYDNNSNITKVEDNNCTRTYTYNNANMLTVINNDGSGSLDTKYSYVYNYDGNINKATDTNGRIVRYEYNSSNQLTGERRNESGIEYYTSYYYNIFGNRTDVYSSEDGYDDYYVKYTYDKNNRLLKEKRENYSIDKSNEISDLVNYTITEYSYDNNGNQISKAKYNQNIDNKFTISINDANTDDSTSYEIFTYDRLNELTEYKKSNGTTATYAYLPNHYRMSKTVDGVLTQQIWDVDNIVAEANSSNTILRGYTRGHQLLTDDDRRAYMYDGHGNLVQQNRGTVAENITRYDAYGNKVESSNVNDVPFGYCGEYLDSESGLIYLRNRYYDSESGMFITEDPIRDGVNWYSYCGGNPVMFWDLLGLEDVYIFYNEADKNNASLGDRAYKRKKELELEGKTVYIKMISNAKQFKEEWDNMDNKGSEIELVELFFHANPQAIIMNGEPLVTESRNYQGDCVHVKDLKEKNINTIILNSCNSAHQDYSTENLAFEFAKYQNVKNVYGWDGSMRWSVLTGKPILNSGTDYFASWLRNGKRSELGFIKYTKSMDTITVYSNIDGQTLNVNDLKNINNYRLLNAYDLNGKPIYYEKTEGVA